MVAAAASVPIKAIDATAVHRIQSGQVIVNLCSVAKELVENGLDAGATSIEVRFKNQGLDAIEVQDNGSGIAPHNYSSLALKHYTSKLATFDDLDTLQTFGFRGEALSSLCALSRFTVTTCLASDVPKGTKLEFETSGGLGPTSVVAAQKGTTVSVENLFWNLPVRRRELERNVKREWAKVIGLLNQYACIQTGVKFTVSQQPSKGKKVVLFSTKGNVTTRDNIINVFGAKTMGALLALDLTLEMAVTAKSQWAAAVTAATTASTDGSGPSSSNTQEIHVRGYVSRPAHGQGRQTPDRQMFYVNGRPCKLPQFAQLFGEVYRSYNSGQSPFIFADIQLDTHLYDVNVSPDKQTILLHDQGRMLDTLRESLIELFEKQDITVPISQLASQKLTAFKKTTPPAAASTSSRTSSVVPVPPPGAVGDSGGVKRAPVEDEAGNGEEEEEPFEESLEHDAGSDDGTRGETKQNGATEVASDESVKRNECETTSSLPPRPPPIQRPSRTDTTNVVIYPGPRKRLSDEVATVTVGNETVSTTMLSSSKRQRIAASGTTVGQPMSTEAELQKKKRPKAPLPSFGGRLTQMFSAARPSHNEEGDDQEESNIGGDVYSAGDDDGDASEDREERSSQEEELDDDLEIQSDEDEGVEEEVDVEVEEDLDQDILSGDDAEGDEVEHEAEDDDDQVQSLPMDGIIRHKEALEGHEPMDEDEEDDGVKEEEEEEEIVESDEDEQEMEQDNGSRRASTARESRVATDDDRRGRLFLKSSGSKKRHETLQLVQVLKANETMVKKQAASWHTTCSEKPEASNTGRLRKGDSKNDNGDDDDDDDDNYRPDTSGGLDDTEAAAEAKLALTIVKSDFAKMRVVGQFNLGFVLAVREGTHKEGEAEEEQTDQTKKVKADDELFIIDQHASDEKYNFERLQASTVVQSQRLVQPKRLELTAVEEEIVLEHLPALAANGFVVDAELDGSEPVGSRCRLRTLPLSRETTFDLTDLEELIALLGDYGDSAAQMTAVPRPAKVRKMFAMRACRSSIMIGKALSRQQMASVLAHMGEMDKPWNCPHGRPTMRHLCSLGTAWDRGRVWGDGGDGGDGGDRGGDAERGDAQSVSNADWARFLRKRRRVAKA